MLASNVTLEKRPLKVSPVGNGLHVEREQQQARLLFITFRQEVSIQLKVAILLVWLIETGVFQFPQLHKHFNGRRNYKHSTHIK
jgi:hypothetical protein